MKILMTLLSLLASAAWAQATISLKVLSSAVNLESHQVIIDLQNEDDKTVVGYVLEVKLLDASGKDLTDTRLGIDHAYYNPTNDATYSGEAYLIHSGRTGTERIGVDPQAVSVQVTVLASIYSDRTVEGDASAASAIFALRRRVAQNLEQAAERTKGSPATSEAARATVLGLRDLEDAHVDAALSETLGIPMDTLTHKERALPAVAAGAREWEGTHDRLSAEASF
ncbi:MAG TPA: hypothetical protein VHU83_13025 [Bryobacteraceae bacterium]|jgi:hypothetical protein|nr:hypothetical protein [Bryobacteraceae bacterium]